MEVLKRVDKQDLFRKEIEELAKQIEQDDLKVITFMEYTTPPEKVKPKLIKFEKVLPLLERIAESGKIQEGVAKIMFFSPSTGRNKGLTPTMMAGFQLIKPGVSTKPHSHNMASIYLVFKGQGYSVIGNDKIQWNAGDVFVVPANEIHYHVNTGDEDCVLFDVTDSGLLESLGILEFRE
ncbi:cupin domain-containing protein [Saccharolobus islandicus]|uniref:Cupin 2 conserved barrel domain protein n=1 Tax=Saccharolobus islandicus (strain REY15A) TaxID=930945 RepID=F0NI67_SACI5|nr:cupin domain-containing protein [Sulfolobus islandicus]ADX85431.1 Cupin 2 conserved barrel domain protein [Sulfolobus islandicus REY15A]